VVAIVRLIGSGTRDANIPRCSPREHFGSCRNRRRPLQKTSPLIITPKVSDYASGVLHRWNWYLRTSAYGVGSFAIGRSSRQSQLKFTADPEKNRNQPKSTKKNGVSSERFVDEDENGLLSCSTCCAAARSIRKKYCEDQCPDNFDFASVAARKSLSSTAHPRNSVIGHGRAIAGYVLSNRVK
jgi:hypothetical protein